MKRYLRLLPVIMVCLPLVACKGKTMIREDASAADAAAEAVTVPEDEVMAEDLAGAGAKASDMETASISTGDITAEVEQVGLKTVHFDFDRYNIREGDKAILKRNAQWLKNNSGVRIVIEGHADERGENEYNLALGEKRATSVKGYLQALGVSPSRLDTISYGEERPADPGHDESAWSRNRRAEFRIAR